MNNYETIMRITRLLFEEIADYKRRKSGKGEISKCESRMVSLLKIENELDDMEIERCANCLRPIKDKCGTKSEKGQLCAECSIKIICYIKFWHLFLPHMFGKLPQKIKILFDFRFGELEIFWFVDARV